MSREEQLQIDEPVQVEKEKSALTDLLTREQEENAQKAVEIVGLNQRLIDRQAKWDQHTCVTPMTDEPETTLKQLTKAVADLKVSEIETCSVRQQLKEAEAALATNQKVTTSLQREVDKLREETQA